MNPKSESSSSFSSAEAQRLYYLQQLGVASYYPRFILPGALPSEACEMPDWRPPAEPAASAQEDVQGRQQETAAVPAPAADSRGQNLATGVPGRSRPRIELDDQPAVQATVPQHEVSPPAAEESMQRAADSATEDSHPLQFSLVLMQAESGLAACVQVPSLSQATLSKAEFRLMHNILHWLGTPLRDDLAMRSFSWPLPGIAEQSAELAARSLSGFLQQARQELGFSCLLVMGSGLHAVAGNLQSGDGQEDWQQIHTHSLAEMLAVPELKRSCWQQLQPLHARLSKGNGQA